MPGLLFKIIVRESVSPVCKIHYACQNKAPVVVKPQNYVSETPLEEDIVSLLNTVGTQGNRPMLSEVQEHTCL